MIREFDLQNHLFWPDRKEAFKSPDEILPVPVTANSSGDFIKTPTATRSKAGRNVPRFSGIRKMGIKLRSWGLGINILKSEEEKGNVSNSTGGWDQVEKLGARHKYFEV